MLAIHFTIPIGPVPNEVSFGSPTKTIGALTLATGAVAGLLQNVCRVLSADKQKVGLTDSVPCSPTHLTLHNCHMTLTMSLLVNPFTLFPDHGELCLSAFWWRQAQVYRGPVCTV